MVKIAIFHTLPAFDAPLGGGGGVTRRNIAITFGTEKTGMMWLSEGEKSLMTFLTVSTQYRRVTERETDGRADGLTSCDSVVRAMPSIVR